MEGRREMGVWREGKKRERKRERREGSIDHFTPPSPFYHHHLLLGCFWRLWSTRAFEKELKGSVLIKYSFGVKLVWHHRQPLTTGPSFHSCNLQRDKCKKITKTHTATHTPVWEAHNIHAAQCARAPLTTTTTTTPTHTARSHLQVVDEPRVVELCLFSIDGFRVDTHFSISLGVHLNPEDEKMCEIYHSRRWRKQYSISRDKKLPFDALHFILQKVF